jgi:hypothetical protein
MANKNEKKRWELSDEENEQLLKEETRIMIEKAKKKLEKIKILNEGYIESVENFLDEKENNLYFWNSKQRANSDKYRLLLVDEMKKLSDILFKRDA